ncbi:threonine aldolase [Paratrimastix pyriformis]|uniref:Threonine aldolase n=1 Tax=Paratrimastix pyriformis TaxID=342808 RepID=A0ABQ8U7M4_9EUKA|nr:threonine aldolase [Paratrimastix pyriformis]
MRKAMCEAEVGDDVAGEDPTMNRLQDFAAELLGKEAALFVPSGTFGNQLCVMTHCVPGNEVIVSESAHVIEHEAGAAGRLSGVNFRAISPRGGHYITADEIKLRIRAQEDIHFPATGLIWLENALSDGTVMPVAEMEAVKALADRFGIPVHLDGARVCGKHFFSASVD